MPSGITLGVHAFALVIALLLMINNAAMALLCLVPGALIALGSWRSVPDRPLCLYASFGVLMGLSFWSSVCDMNRGDFLMVVPMVFLIAAVSWLLYDPNTGSIVTASVVVLLLILLAVLALVFPPEYPDEIQPVRESALTVLGLLVMGLAYLGVGAAEVLSPLKPVTKEAPVKRKKRRPPLRRVDEDFEPL